MVQSPETGMEDDNDEQVFEIGGTEDSTSTVQEEPKRRSGRAYDAAYEEWLADKTPENMAKILDAFAPTINSEITRYEGSRNLLRSRARVLTVKAVKSYNPASGARLQSWVVTNLKPLARYGQRQRDVRAPEMAIRQAAAVDRVTRELRDDLGRDPTDDEIADEIGISPKRVAYVRDKARASVASGSLDEISVSGEQGSVAPAVVETDPVPFATEAVYMSLSPEDREVFDGMTGGHGKPMIGGTGLARKLGISPAAVSARASRIAGMISEVADGWR